MSGDGIEAKVKAFVTVHPAPPRVRIGDDLLVFPPGTTNEEAQSVLDEAKRRYLESLP